MRFWPKANPKSDAQKRKLAERKEAQKRAEIRRTLAPLATRQAKREMLFRASLADLNQQYGGELRRRRRAMARAIAQKSWRELVSNRKAKKEAVG